MSYAFNDSGIGTISGAFAGDDYLGVDGGANGPRKILGSRFGLLDQAQSWSLLQTFASVAINGGNINATAIGGTTRAAGAFTNLAIGAAAFAQQGLLIGGNITDDASGNDPIGINIAAGLVANTKFRSSCLLRLAGGFSNTTWGYLETSGVRIETPSLTGSSGTHYQIYIGAAPAASTKYGIYQAGTDANYFGGSIQAGSIQNTPIGNTTPNTGKFTTLTATGTGSFLGTTGATTAGRFITFSNDGGTAYFGLDSSTAGNFGFGNYAFNLYTAGDFVISRGGGEKLRTTSTQVKITGTLFASNNLEVGGVAYFASGSVSAPSLILNSETGTGLYRIGANNHGYAVSGAKVLDIASTGLAVTGAITATGNVGIGTTAPFMPLHVQKGTPMTPPTWNTAADLLVISNDSANNAVMQIFTANNKVGAIHFSDTDARAVGWLYYDHSANLLSFGTNSTERIRLNSAGALQFTAYGAGTLVTDASGNVTASSDGRMKDVLGTFDRGLAAVCGITPKLFKWNAESGLDTEAVNAGFIAQDVLPHIPEAIHEKGGRFSMSDRPIIAALVNAVKELSARLEALEAARA